MENNVDEVVNQIKEEARRLNINQIKFRNAGAIYSAISRSTASMNRYADLAKTFEEYAKEETNPKLKSRYEAEAQRYRNLASQSQESISRNEAKLGIVNAQIDLVNENIQKLLSETDPIKILDILRNLIGGLDALNYNIKTLKDLAEKLNALLEQPFTIILEYVVSW